MGRRGRDGAHLLVVLHGGGSSGGARPREPEEAHREELLEDEEVTREVKLKAFVDARLGCGEDQWKALVRWIDGLVGGGSAVVG